MTDDAELAQRESPSRQPDADVQAELEEQRRDDQVRVGKVCSSRSELAIIDLMTNSERDDSP